MKLYTKTGDDGTTGLFGGARVKKSSGRVEAYGTIDELNASLGVVRSVPDLSRRADALLGRIQSELFVLGAELACVPGKEGSMKLALLDASHAQALEADIDATEERVAPLKSFILPGGVAASAHLHFARTICRRAERRAIEVGEQGEPVRPELLMYLNRLSDLLFVLARAENAEQHRDDVEWAPRRV